MTDAELRYRLYRLEEAGRLRRENNVRLAVVLVTFGAVLVYRLANR